MGWKQHYPLVATTLSKMAHMDNNTIPNWNNTIRENNFCQKQNSFSLAINTSVIKIKKEDRDNFERENKYLNEQLSMKSAHCEQLSSQKTELVLSNAELTARVQKLEEELATIKKRVSDLENIFYKNGVTPDKLEEMIRKSANLSN